MDYLDRQKQFREHILLLVGYVLIGVAIVTAALILLYQSYGFTLDKKGAVIQRGLTFFSSHPSPANIYVNGKIQPVSTNTRLVLPSGIYRISLFREGYHDWQRRVEINGGKVAHYDYPFLFPKNLDTKKIQTYASAPGFSTQSPDHRWLLVQAPASVQNFDVYDLKNPDKPAETLNLPASLVTGAGTWQLAEWSSDNRHVLLEYDLGGKSEFVVVDRTNPDLSVNLNAALSANPTKVTLSDRRYDHYYLYDSTTGSLQTASLDKPAPVPYQQHVLAYKTYGANTVLYVTDNAAPAGKVLVRLAEGAKTYTVRKLPAGTSYVVDLTKYSGDMYVAAGAAADNRVFIYKDPFGQVDAQPKQAPAIAQVLHVDSVNYLSFSSNAQFVTAENGQRFGVYDIENQTGYNYVASQPLDAPQQHASWMDGDRLTYTSGGKLTVFDYDFLNQHALSEQSAGYLPAFSPDYKFVYALAPAANGQVDLTQTWLLTPADR